MPIPPVSSPLRPAWLTPVGIALSAWTAAGASAQCAGLPLAPDAVAAQIVALSGQGETRPPGTQPWLPATLAQPLGPGADMRTLALSSAALLLADRTQIRMSANAQLRLCEAQPTRTLLELAAGRLWARTKKAPATCNCKRRQRWPWCGVPTGTWRWTERGGPRSPCCPAPSSCATTRAVCSWGPPSRAWPNLVTRPSSACWSTPASGCSGWPLTRAT